MGTDALRWTLAAAEEPYADQLRALHRLNVSRKLRALCDYAARDGVEPGNYLEAAEWAEQVEAVDLGMGKVEAFSWEPGRDP